ncbi:ribonuclease P protein subunit [Candidatus Bathyarchaeota archaeon]|nr:ribonuclease P protein component 1 [Candidatus Bathyarchaeota archaeon]NIU80676.1 ribonuclease P protein subunit [Candidatus Bathyarchaeota archaeon]NIV67297.1 ribonuclease P protein subunit [Candidatus Bathyarchaeota archaeon]NIW15858.1 ribonuclease P protein subunit [Candidatus Bathyarchaeota archaeon]NIW33969.1 ribonuclease P protein subunit [Candidatus Bathyarchaeota archaeon]
MTPRIIQREFIGLNAEVVNSSNPTCVGISGRVVDETRNLLFIKHQNEKKAIVKNTAVFHFTLADGTVVEIDGKTLIGRPEDRVKKRIRRLW